MHLGIFLISSAWQRRRTADENFQTSWRPPCSIVTVSAWPIVLYCCTDHCSGTVCLNTSMQSAYRQLQFFRRQLKLYFSKPGHYSTDRHISLKLLYLGQMTHNVTQCKVIIAIDFYSRLDEQLPFLTQLPTPWYDLVNVEYVTDTRTLWVLFGAYSRSFCEWTTRCSSCGQVTFWMCFVCLLAKQQTALSEKINFRILCFARHVQSEVRK